MSTMKSVGLLAFRVCGAGTGPMFAALFAVASAQAAIVVVVCPGDSLGTAVQNASPGDQLNISGVCMENVEIRTDDLTLEGGTVEGTITILSQRAVLDGMTVTGPGDGVVGRDNASFTVQNSTIEENDGIGILATAGASAVIRDNDITDNDSDGIGVFDNAFASVTDNVIQGNGDPANFEAGIELSRARVVSSGNTIENNGWAGVSAFNASSYRNQSSATDIIEQVVANTFAVAAGNHSSVDFRGADIEGDIDIGRNSTLQLRSSSLEGNVSLGDDSVAEIRNMPLFEGNILANNDSVIRMRNMTFEGDLSVFVGSSAQLANVTLKGNTQANNQAALTVVNSTIEGAFGIGERSTASVRDTSMAEDVGASFNSTVLLENVAVAGDKDIILFGNSYGSLINVGPVGNLDIDLRSVAFIGGGTSLSGSVMVGREGFLSIGDVSSVNGAVNLSTGSTVDVDLLGIITLTGGIACDGSATVLPLPSSVGAIHTISSECGLDSLFELQQRIEALELALIP